MMLEHAEPPAMAHDPRDLRGAQQRSRADGVTIAPAPGSRKQLFALAGAAALAAFALLVLVGPPRREEPRASEADQSAPAARETARSDAPTPPVIAPRPKAHPVRAHAQPPAPPPDAPAASAEKPASEAEQDPLASTPSGIGLFPPPGTDPPKLGIVVPEDFELPEGYVRHYQATDDGQALPPILMFHPDYVWQDETGAQVEVAPDGVVPPELAPEGMPIEMLELPETPSEP
jgi:hypothetical protein